MTADGSGASAIPISAAFIDKKHGSTNDIRVVGSGTGAVARRRLVVREIRTLRAMWRVLETEPRQFLTGHEEGLCQEDANSVMLYER